MLSWITLVVTLCCTSCGVIKGIGIYSQTTEEKLLSDVQTLVKNFSYAMDLSLEKDSEVYKTVSNDFANILPKCEIIPSCASSVIVTIVRGMYNLYSYVTKDQLSSGKTQVVTITTLEKTVPWASSLLDLALKRPQIAIHMLKCYETTSALHLTAMFRMHVTLQKLLTRSTNCINSKSVELFSYTPLHISIVNRDVTMTELLLSHCASTTITDEFGRSSLDLAMNIFYDDGDDEMLRILTENKYCNSSGDEDILWRNRQNISSCHQKLDGKSCVDGNKGDVVKRKLLSCPAMASIHVSNLTFESFVEDYLSQRRPLLIKGAADHWKVRKTWSMQSLSQNVYSNIELLVGKIPYADVFGGNSEKVTLRNYLAYLQVVNSHSNSKNAPYYAFDPYILEENSTIGLSFYNISENSHPKWLINALMTKGIAHSFTNTVTSHKQFYMGPVLSVSEYIVLYLINPCNSANGHTFKLP